MHVSKITLDQYRRYDHLSMEIPQAGLRIVGRNASGKTSFLEALLLLATTKTPRVTTERELIRWGSGSDYGLQPYARLSARVHGKSGDHVLEIRLEASASNESLTRKTCLLDGKSVRASTMVGVLKVVEFSPEDVQLVAGPPAGRRRQLDVLISQIDRHYMQTSARYQKVLTQRNGLLRSFQRDGVSWRSIPAIEQLTFWDDELVRHGAQLIATRVRVVAELAGKVEHWSRELMHDHVVSLGLISGVPHLDRLLTQHGDADDLANRVMDQFAREIELARAEDFRRGSTSIGPQRDDIVFTVDDRSLAAYGSRGQQRLGVIAIKLGEADVIHQLTGEQPVLLLDDALSELDMQHATWLMDCIATSDRQLLLTSAVEGALDHEELAHLELMTLESSLG
ncbi:MAG: DNA replication and repair protein RecF [Thermomicrobiales bacterium]|nr:DNA replication and repair protein RecF [Thermomicrobiales bacterium]